MLPDHLLTRLVTLLTVALLGGGAFGAFSSFTLQRGAWPWPMPDLAYRFLAGAAAAYAVGSAMALARRHWAASELLLATVVIYGIPLGAAMLVDAALVDWGEPVAWGFVGLVVPALLISGVALARNRRLVADSGAAPLDPALRWFL